jgi:transcriptional regulator with XRE-family HTH domain
MTKKAIDGTAVRQLRRSLDIKQQALAQAVGVDSGTISRIERGRIKSIHPELFEGLREALKADHARLGGARAAETNKSPMQLSVDDACRNAMFLVAYRYGITTNEIVEAAPLCFYLLAEHSLRWRERRLQETEDHIEKIEPRYRSMEAETDLASERESIIARDLGLSGDHDRDFVDFMRGLFAKLGRPDTMLHWTNDGPHYQICNDEASAIVAGDSEAAKAILSGTVALRKIPAAVRKSAGPELATWVKKLQREAATAETDDDVTMLELPTVEALEIDLDSLPE